MFGLFNPIKSTTIFSVAFCLMFSCASAYADPPELTGVGTFGGAYSLVTGITRDGATVFGNSYDGSNHVHGFILQNGIMTDVGTLGGGTGSSVFGTSADGSVAIGEAETGSSSHAFRWVGGVMTDLGTLGGANSSASVISADGSIIAGVAYTAGNSRNIFRWDAVNGMVDLGTLGGTTVGDVAAMSQDGSVIGGISSIAGNTGVHAFRWDAVNNMVDLGTLGGGASYLKGLSDDGSIAVGYAYTAGNAALRAYRWDSVNNMVDLGTLGGTDSAANAISGDGSVIVGHSNLAGNAQTNAFRWDAVNGMVDLGNLGGPLSTATTVSTDGSVIAGQSFDSVGAYFLDFYWTQSTGMQSLHDILTAAGVDYTGWVLAGTVYLSGNGDYLAGTGTFNGNQTGFIFRYGVPGLTTPSAVVASLHTINTANRQAAFVSAQQNDQSLFTARHINSLAIVSTPKNYSAIGSSYTSTADGSVSDINSDASFGELSPNLRARRGLAAYTSGSVGFGQNNNFDNHDVNGTVGVDMRLSDSLNIGVGILGAHSRIDLAFDGTARTTARGVSSILSYEPEDFGLRVYGSAFVADLDTDRTRGYMNGSGLDFSRGKTDGTTYGGAAQLGWQFPVTEKSSLMPYAEVQTSETKLDAYTETGGAFPASFTDQETTSVTSHLGVEQTYNLSPAVNVLGRVAWGHRWDDGGDAFTGTSAGLTQTLGGGDDNDKNWAEVTIGMGWQASEKFHMNVEVSGRSGDTAEPAVNLTFGASYAF